MNSDRRNEPSDEDVHTVMLANVIREQDAQTQSMQSLRAQYARADQYGMNLPAIKRATRVLKSGKKDEMVKEIEATLYYLRLLGNPVESAQLDMFKKTGAEPRRSAPEDEKAYVEGLRAGLLGHGENQNPHAENTPKGMKWLEGIRAGLVQRGAIEAMVPPHPADHGDGDEIDEEAA
jgi:ribosome modulation factor